MQLTDTFYYLNNFELVLGSIKNRYADLLDYAEGHFIEAFANLPKASRALTVRMVMRKRRLFLARHLQYDEIEALHEAMAPLIDAGWVELDPTLSIDDLFELFTKPHLLELLNLSGLDLQRKKAALLQHCRSQFPMAQTLAQWSERCPMQVYRVGIGSLCERLRLLYFGNFHQSWSEFVLADLGVRRFEQFGPAAARPFANRDQWDHFETIHRCRELLHAEADPGTVLAQMPPALGGCDWLEARRQRLLYQLGQAFERAQDPQSALSVYESIAHAGAAVRAIRIQERGDDAVTILRACEAALERCQHELDRVLLARAQQRLRRRLGLQLLPKPYKFTAPTPIALVLEQPEHPYRVEQVVSEHLMREEPQTQVYYVENCLINGLFGLQCWRALFAPIVGAFFHPFHREPADLGDVRFFERRRLEFESCFAELDGDTYQQTILGNFHVKHGIDNAFVLWSAIDEPMLHVALGCIPARHLKGWFQLMARDYAINRCGFPDLIQFWPDEHRYRLIEVKAPGDRLQDNQRRILSVCDSLDMSVAVCNVRWSDRTQLAAS